MAAPWSPPDIAPDVWQGTCPAAVRPLKLPRTSFRLTPLSVIQMPAVAFPQNDAKVPDTRRGFHDGMSWVVGMWVGSVNDEPSESRICLTTLARG